MCIFTPTTCNLTIHPESSILVLKHGRPAEKLCGVPVQYSAASFIETINTQSLSMEADEFIAHMVAGGVPDMQLIPNPAVDRPISPPAQNPKAPTPPPLIGGATSLCRI